MIPLVEFPELVEHYAPEFQDVFSAEAYIEFKRYISGLIVSENKTIDGINRLMVVESRNQTSLNRLLAQSPFSLDGLNRRRLRMLARSPGTQMKAKGVLSIDDTLLTHYGNHFDQIAMLYDHVNESYRWSHNLVTMHYSDDETDYPVLFQLWKPVELAKLEAGMREAGVPIKASKEALKESAPTKWRSYLIGVWNRRRQQYPAIQGLYKTKLDMAHAMVKQWSKAHPEQKRPVTFDSWYTQPDFCRCLDRELQVPYVGTLEEDNELILKDGKKTVGCFAGQLKQEHLDAVDTGGAPVFQPITIGFKGDKETYYSYCQTHRVKHYGKQRLVINHRQADLTDNPTYFISNRLRWQAKGITRIRRHRWPVEVYHQEGKAEGLDQYQMRSFSAIERHIALVAVTYSMLRAAQHDSRLRHRLQRQLEVTLEGQPAAWRRATQAQCLWSLALFISSGLAQGHSLDSLMRPLIQATCSG
jgi:hypothetical protein